MLIDVTKFFQKVKSTNDEIQLCVSPNVFHKLFTIHAMISIFLSQVAWFKKNQLNIIFFKFTFAQFFFKKKIKTQWQCFVNFFFSYSWHWSLSVKIYFLLINFHLFQNHYHCSSWIELYLRRNKHQKNHLKIHLNLGRDKNEKKKTTKKKKSNIIPIQFHFQLISPTSLLLLLLFSSLSNYQLFIF